MTVKARKEVKGRFSSTEGSSLRVVIDPSTNEYMGVIRKLEDGSGYKILRRDGKIRTKRTLKEAFKTVRRAN